MTPPLKQKIESSTPMGEKLMTDAMRSTQTSRILAGLQVLTPGGSSSGTMGGAIQMPRVVEKERQEKGVYIPYWNVRKTSRLTTVDEKSEWVDNMLRSGARTKFEIFKKMELGSRLDHNIYEVRILKVLRT